MKVLEVKDINKTFGNHHVLKNISLSVNEGEVVSIIGPSGSGKSTLSKQIRDMYNIQWVSLDSLMFWLVKKERSPEDVLNQDPVLYKYLVEHNIDFNYLYNKYYIL